MQLQAYEGYFNNGQFYVSGKAMRIPERRQVTLIFNEQPPADTLINDLAAMEKFINAMQASDEEVPLSFERVKLREVEV